MDLNRIRNRLSCGKQEATIICAVCSKSRSTITHPPCMTIHQNDRHTHSIVNSQWSKRDPAPPFKFLGYFFISWHQGFDFKHLLIHFPGVSNFISLFKTQFASNRLRFWLCKWILAPVNYYSSTMLPTFLELPTWMGSTLKCFKVKIQPWWHHFAYSWLSCRLPDKLQVVFLYFFQNFLVAHRSVGMLL